ncbi:uncharacterized protein PV09_05234 [Verruconis gallopava]|uniref:Copper transport protein n=1 Tax=Verruconis gallopava TaxID=253628 RepID=A0A0D2AA73_9PEZI|nr:uncharacterized protein PV09_05234 [Verruconis gallopava]KIW03465.1 hypothetical protein PV09_05234 [Verruconis gallopava]
MSMSMSNMAMGTSSAMASMTSMTMTGTATASSATSTAMKMSMGGSCKISMLWNWNTVDSCFIAASWHVTSKGMFAGCCVGVIFLVVALEFLRRCGKEYDRYLLREHQRKLAVVGTTTSSPCFSNAHAKNSTASIASRCAPVMRFRPNVLQQAVRALVHMLAFAVAYFIMLLAMYYNGYFIICIFIGAYIGFFIFGWETVSLGGPQEETTVCCG